MHGWGGDGDVHRHRLRPSARLALVGRRLPDRVRTYLLTFSVVDDLTALVVIAIFYSGNIQMVALAWGDRVHRPGPGAAGRRGNRNGILYLLIGIAAWVAFPQVGRGPDRGRPGLRPADLRLLGEPGIAGTGIRGVSGSSASSPPPNSPSPRATVVRTAISPNDRLAQLFHPWTSYVIVPLFALANSGIVLNTEFLARAYTAPVTLGIIAGYLVGKPLGTVGCAWLVSKVTHGRVRPSVGWGRGGGHRHGRRDRLHRVPADRVAGTARRRGWPRRSSASCPPSWRRRPLTWVIFRVVNKLPVRARFRAPAGYRRGHHRPGGAGGTRSGITSAGPEESMVTLVEYGDFECPYCGMAEPVVRELLRDYGEIPVRVAAPAADRRAPERSARGRGHRGSRPAGRVSGRCTTLLLDHQGRTAPPGPHGVRGLARPRHRPVSPPTCASTRERRTSAKTWNPPTCPMCPGLRRFSSTASGIMAPMT